jgi:nicotinamide mononucleotide transporter
VAVYGVFLAALLVLPVWLGMPSAAMPLLDALTTALGVVATWMLARRYLEQWLIWVFVDLLSAGMYFYKGLYPTAILFLVYTAMALVGYVAWKKEFISNSTGL